MPCWIRICAQNHQSRKVGHSALGSPLFPGRWSPDAVMLSSSNWSPWCPWTGPIFSGKQSKWQSALHFFIISSNNITTISSNGTNRNQSILMIIALLIKSQRPSGKGRILQDSRRQQSSRSQRRCWVSHYTLWSWSTIAYGHEKYITICEMLH